MRFDDQNTSGFLQSGANNHVIGMQTITAQPNATEDFRMLDMEVRKTVLNT